MTDTTLSQPARRTRRMKIPLLVLGSFTVVLAVGLLALGGGALWADGEKDGRGYITSDAERFTASTAALVTDDLDIDLDGSFVGLDDAGTLRLDVRPAGDEPMFVGIARSDDVDRYLDGVAHTTLTDVAYDPFEADTRDHAGARSAPKPAKQDIWVASTRGAGPQELTWDVEDGDWSIVAMNADGSPGVQTGVAAGVKLDWLEPLGWSALGSGAALLLAAAGMIVLGLTPPRARGGGASAPAQTATMVVAPTP